MIVISADDVAVDRDLTAREQIFSGNSSDILRIRRLFSLVYDSVRQRDLVAARVSQGSQSGSESLRANLLARLRLDSILSGQVVVTDAQVLDGALFASVNPSDVATALGFLPGSAARLVVRTRGQDLHESVVGLVTDAESGTIKPFQFSLIADDAERAKVERHLHELRSRGYRAPTELGELEAHLRRAGLDEHWIAVLQRHWTAWTAARGSDQSGAAIAVEPFQPRGLDLSHALDLADGDGDHPDQLVDLFSSKGIAAIHEVRHAIEAGRLLRTDLYRTVDEGYGEEDSPESALEKLMIKQYIDKIFGLASRDQHGCKDFDSVGQIPTQPVAGRAGQRADQRMLENLEREMLCDIGIPSDFLARLAFAGSEDLLDWVDVYTDDLAEWRERGKGNALRSAIRGLEEMLATVVPPRRLARRLEMERTSKRGQGGVVQLIKRHGGDVVGLSSPELGTLNSVVRLVAGTAAVTSERLFGNPTIITTDVALPRREGGPRG